MYRGFIVLSILAATTGLLSACPSSTLQGGARLTICQSNYDPVELPTANPLIPSTLKAPVHFSADGKINLPQGNATGDYGFVSANIFVYDSANDIHLDFSEAADLNVPAQWDMGVFCLAGNGINPKMAAISETIPFISDLKFMPDGSFQVRDHSLLFSIAKPTPTAGWLSPPTDPNPDQTWHSGSPLHTYDQDPEFTVADQYIIDTNPAGATGNIAIQTYLRKAATATPDDHSPGPGRPVAQLPGAGRLATCPDNTICVNIQVNMTRLTDDQRAKRDKQAADLLLQQQHHGATPPPTSKKR